MTIIFIRLRNPWRRRTGVVYDTPAKIRDLHLYRCSIPEEQRKVNHHIWWSGLIEKARKARLAKERDRNNRRNRPR